MTAVFSRLYGDRSVSAGILIKSCNVLLKHFFTAVCYFALKFGRDVNYYVLSQFLLSKIISF